MKILFLSKYCIEGPSSRYRFYNYKSYFEEEGIICIFKPLLSKNYVANLYKNKKIKVKMQSVFSILKRLFFLLFNSKGFDIIIIEKELFPNFPFFIEAYLLKNYNYALDFDDYIATNYKQNPFMSLFLFNKIDQLAREAKFVTVGNHWYFDEIKSNNLIYLPTVINLDYYAAVKQNYNNEKITIVWIGSPSTAKYLNLIIPVLKCLNKKYPIKFKVTLHVNKNATSISKIKKRIAII